MSDMMKPSREELNLANLIAERVGSTQQILLTGLSEKDKDEIRQIFREELEEVRLRKWNLHEIKKEEYTCNLCGEVCSVQCTRDNLIRNNCGLLEVDAYGAYGSSYLCDGYEYTFNLCEKCCAKLFKRMKIKPIVTDVLGHTHERVEFALMPGPKVKK